MSRLSRVKINNRRTIPRVEINNRRIIPRVEIYNRRSTDATIITVRSDPNDHKKLLEAVEVLTRLNLTITSAYISQARDCSFKHVFYVNRIPDKGNQAGEIKKLEGPNTVHGQQIGPSTSDPVRVEQLRGCTSFKIEGSNRPGFLSEVLDVLITRDRYNLVNAVVWTDNTRTTGEVQVTYKRQAITDPERLSAIKRLLGKVLNGSNRSSPNPRVESQRPIVNVDSPQNQNHSIVEIRSKKTPKLLFHVVRTLTEMKYVVYNGNVNTSDGNEPFYHQVYKITHVKTKVEKQRLIHYLEAAIEGRVLSEEIMLELCTDDRFGLLYDITKIFHRRELNVTKAEVTKRSGKAVCTFYVCNKEPGRPVDSNIIDSIREAILNYIQRS